MHLNHLRHLVALAEHQSFRKAAEALFLTQPALSRSIQALEQELGVKLVDRDGKRSALTAYGALVAAGLTAAETCARTNGMLTRRFLDQIRR